MKSAEYTTVGREGPTASLSNKILETKQVGREIGRGPSRTRVAALGEVWREKGREEPGMEIIGQSSFSRPAKSLQN